MLKDVISLFTGAFGSGSPSRSGDFSRRPGGSSLAHPGIPTAHATMMSALHQRTSQLGNLDVDRVGGAIASAQQGNMTDLLALYRDIESADTTIQGAINTRKLAVVARGFSVFAAPNTGEAGEQVADLVDAMLRRSKSFIDACTWLLHGCIWPVSVCNLRWVPGAGGFSHPEFRNVPLEQWDYQTRTLRIKDVHEDGSLATTSHYPDDKHYIVHRGHMLMAPDLWGGPMRALVFWFLFATQTREWWARFLERFGSPFFVGRYDKNDEDSRMNLVQAFSEATRLFGIVATTETQVEIKEAGATQGASAAFQMFHECAKHEKLFLILGQTLSSSAQSTGLGSGVADLQGQVREDVKLWDAYKLQNTIRDAVIEPWMRMNGIQGPVPYVNFGGFDPAALVGIAKFLEALPKTGLELEDDSITVVSRYAGIALRRAAPPPAPIIAPPGAAGDNPIASALLLACAGLLPSTRANERVARDVSADLSQAFSDDLAPLGQIVVTSRSRDELLRRAGAFVRGYRPGRSAELLQEALLAHSINAITQQSDPPLDN